MTLVEFRCPGCDKLIFKVSDLAGVEVEAQCPRCKTLVRAQRSDEAPAATAATVTTG